MTAPAKKAGQAAPVTTLSDALAKPFAFTEWAGVPEGRFTVAVTPTRPGKPFNVMLERSTDNGLTTQTIRVFFRDTEAGFYELHGALYRFRALATLDQTIEVRLRT